MTWNGSVQACKRTQPTIAGVFALSKRTAKRASVRRREFGFDLLMRAGKSGSRPSALVIGAKKIFPQLTTAYRKGGETGEFRFLLIFDFVGRLFEGPGGDGGHDKYGCQEKAKVKEVKGS